VGWWGEGREREREKKKMERKRKRGRSIARREWAACCGWVEMQRGGTANQN
jgi:hypothetical protein